MSLNLRFKKKPKKPGLTDERVGTQKVFVGKWDFMLKSWNRDNYKIRLLIKNITRQDT